MWTAMGVTAFSFVLLPLCLLWAGAPDKLLRLLAVAAVFEAAAALTLGNFGIQPGLMPALTFMAFITSQVLLGASYSTYTAAWRLFRPFVLVAVWAVLSSFLMPHVFEGKVFVWPQKATFPFVLTPLAPNPSNLNQDIYLAINTLFLIMTATYLAQPAIPLGKFFRSYLWSGYLAAAVSVWQFASRVAGVPYPEDLFYSNPGWAILTEQSIGAVPRINGPFSEPSSLGSYMASIVCATGWLLIRGRRDRFIIGLFATGLATIAISTSASGFAVLALIGVGVPGYALLSGQTRILGGVMKIALPLVLAGGFLTAAVTILIPRVGEEAEQVISATLNKQDSSSFEDRTGADLDSLVAVVDTGGLGVGWGSNRSSSLLPGLLAGVGVPGVLGLVWFGFKLTSAVKSARRTGASDEEKFVIDGCGGAIVGYLLGAMLAGPTINSITFFLLLALLVACAARAKLGRRAARTLMSYPRASSVR